MDYETLHELGIFEFEKTSKHKDGVATNWINVFLLYDGNELIGICGVYVDDFIIAGSLNNKKWQLAKANLRKLYKWGNGKLIHSPCAEYDTIKREISRCTWINKNSLEN